MATLNITVTTLPASASNNGYAAGYIAGDGTVFVHMPPSGSNYYRSADGGATWSTIAKPHVSCQSVGWNGTYFLSFNQFTDRWYKSTDGITWSNGTIPVDLFNSLFCWGGTRWVVGSQTSSTNEHLRSTDGESWTAFTVNSQNWMAQDVMWDGTRFCLVIQQQVSAPYDTYLWSSTDATTWNQDAKLNGASGDSANGLFFNGSIYLIANRYPNATYSTNRTSWSDATGAKRVLGRSGSFFVQYDAGSPDDWSISSSATSWTPITVNMTGAGSGVSWQAPYQVSATKFIATSGTKFGVFEVYDPPPPFWTNFVGTVEAI